MQFIEKVLKSLAVDYDVVVAGAGPAGSTTARDIARAGFEVLLIEKRPSVGQPLFCSGLVSPRTLQEARISDGLVLNEIKGVLVHSASGRQLYAGGDKVYALAIDRAALDMKLAEQAQGAGAKLLLDSLLVNIEREGKGLKLSINGNGRASSVTTRMLIGADGVGSMVARWLGVGNSDGVVRAMAAEGWLDGGELNTARVLVGSSVAPGWFGWIIPLGDGRVRIGTGDGNHSLAAPRQLFNNMVAAFPNQFKGIKIDRLWAKAIPIYSPVKTYGDNVLLVGDAARQVKPTSGGGIYTGLVSARHCAGVAVEALEKEDLSESFLSRYEIAWKADLGAELERGIDLRRAFLSLKDEEIDELLGLFSAPFFQKRISLFGDIDFPSRLMEQLVKASPVLRLFLHVPLRFPSRWAVNLLSALSSRGERDDS
ncbi:MAG: NAD(P)/FAD-dependent oxidoreductase [Chloroflexi bacterium]|nr:NAD(P)/FAD-dependent oxidoreductase [Chloroflexota bacterium]